MKCMHKQGVSDMVIQVVLADSGSENFKKIPHALIHSRRTMVQKVFPELLSANSFFDLAVQGAVVS